MALVDTSYSSSLEPKGALWSPLNYIICFKIDRKAISPSLPLIRESHDSLGSRAFNNRATTFNIVVSREATRWPAPGGRRGGGFRNLAARARL